MCGAQAAAPATCRRHNANQLTNSLLTGKEALHVVVHELGWRAAANCCGNAATMNDSIRVGTLDGRQRRLRQQTIVYQLAYML